jgi:hypothetical protein
LAAEELAGAVESDVFFVDEVVAVVSVVGEMPEAGDAPFLLGLGEDGVLDDAVAGGAVAVGAGLSGGEVQVFEVVELAGDAFTSEVPEVKDLGGDPVGVVTGIGEGEVEGVDEAVGYRIDEGDVGGAIPTGALGIAGRFEVGGVLHPEDEHAGIFVIFDLLLFDDAGALGEAGRGDDWGVPAEELVFAVKVDSFVVPVVAAVGGGPGEVPVAGASRFPGE